jgi:hypothetical protein
MKNSGRNLAKDSENWSPESTAGGVLYSSIFLRTKAYGSRDLLLMRKSLRAERK